MPNLPCHSDTPAWSASYLLINGNSQQGPKHVAAAQQEHSYHLPRRYNRNLIDYFISPHKYKEFYISYILSTFVKAVFRCCNTD
jgi:hypothetical protein